MQAAQVTVHRPNDVTDSPAGSRSQKLLKNDVAVTVNSDTSISAHVVDRMTSSPGTERVVTLNTGHSNTPEGEKSSKRRASSDNGEIL